MPTILPVSELRSYTDVLAEVREGSPVFLTRNGRGAYAIVDIRDYDRAAAEQALASDLASGRASGEAEGWVSSDTVRTHFEARLAAAEAVNGR